MLTLLTPLTYLSLFSILWFAVARFIVRERYLGQLYMDTPILLRHINTFTLLLLIVVHILYIAILYRSYVDSFKSYNIFILFMVFVQTICAVFMDQGQGYTILTYGLFLFMSLFSSKNAHIFFLCISLLLTIMSHRFQKKFVRSNTPPVPVVVTCGDLPKFQEFETDKVESRLSDVILVKQDQQERFRDKFEGVQLRRPK